MSKRDAASFFDLLKASEEIHRWFCCPPLRAAELGQALRVPISDLNAFFLEPDGEKLSAKPLLYPASSSWPMDYSWSSAIAQDVTLGILRESGLPEDFVLCDSADLPGISPRWP